MICGIKSILSAALVLMVTSMAHALPACEGGPPCGMPPLKQACSDPESGVEFPKGYACVNDPNKWGWQCEIRDGKFKFYKTKGSGGKRKRDAVCE